MMEESKCSEVVYIFYENRGILVSALEQYLIRYNATHALPERAESLYTPEDVVQGIPLPMRYPFLLL
jgi:hypothetical protein